VQITYFTVLYPTFETAVLFGLKRTKICAGTWVGIGGKMLPGETIAGATIREVDEEAPEITIRTETMRLCGVLDIDEGVTLRRVFVLVGEAASLLTPAPTQEFERFCWYENILNAKDPSETKKLPAPLPKGERVWMPLLFREGEPISVRVSVDGRHAFRRDARIRQWYGLIHEWCL
jgi:hypothetical protein